METTVQCPKCHRTFRIPNHLLGKRIGCLTCKSAFVAQNEGIQPAVRSMPGRILDAAPAPEDGEVERPRRRREGEPPPREDRGRPGVGGTTERPPTCGRWQRCRGESSS
jgi:hypothetical protein